MWFENISRKSLRTISPVAFNDLTGACGWMPSLHREEVSLTTNAGSLFSWLKLGKCYWGRNRCSTSGQSLWVQESHPWRSAGPEDRVIFQGTATHWTCWELLTDALQVTGCQSCLQLWDQFLDNNDIILSHWQNGICQQERSSELMADGDHVKGSPSGQTEMSVHASASVALCDMWHDAACPHFKQMQPLMYSFLWKLN